MKILKVLRCENIFLCVSRSLSYTLNRHVSSLSLFKRRSPVRRKLTPRDLAPQTPPESISTFSTCSLDFDIYVQRGESKFIGTPMIEFADLRREP